MFWQRASFALLAGALLSSVYLPAVHAEEAKAAPAHDCCAPTTCTVCCTEWVQVKVPCERTVYKVEYKTEKYTAWKTECYPVTKTRTVTCYEMVPETRTEWRTVCKIVPVCVEKTIMQKHTVCKPVVKTVCKTVDRGHWETKCEEHKGCLDHLRDWCHRNDCCYQPCPKYKTKKVWVPCLVKEEKQICTTEKFVECRPVVVKCTEYRKVEEKVAVQVTCCKCVAKPKTETYTCYETRKVAVECTRCVKVCVPCKETYEVCKWEKRTVMKQVPCQPCCEPCGRKHHRGGCCH